MTDPLTQWLDEMEAKAKAATPGPRVATDDVWPEIRQDDKLIAELGNHYGMETGERVDEDARYIAALPPETVSALLECVRAAALASDEIQSQRTAWPGEVDDLADALARLRRMALGDA